MSPFPRSRLRLRRQPAVDRNFRTSNDRVATWRALSTLRNPLRPRRNVPQLLTIDRLLGEYQALPPAASPLARIDRLVAIRSEVTSLLANPQGRRQAAETLQQFIRDELADQVLERNGREYVVADELRRDGTIRLVPRDGQPLQEEGGNNEDRALYLQRRRALDESGGAMQTTEAFVREGVDHNNRNALFLPESWLPERQALQQRLIDDALSDAQLFADEMEGEPTVHAMRGNTAAGKTRAIRGNIPVLEGPVDRTKLLRHRAVNPDNFKQDLYDDAPGMHLNSTQVHQESSILSKRVRRNRLANLEKSDGTLGSMLIDRRLAGRAEIDELVNLAQTSGRRLNIYDIDAPLEMSLAGVLMRTPGGNDPIPDFDVVGTGGFLPIRENRMDVIQRFIDNDELGRYELYATDAQGNKFLVATVENGNLNIVEGQGQVFEQITAATVEDVNAVGDQQITQQLIDDLTGPLPAVFAAAMREALTPHIGRTWRQALEHHSQQPAGGGE